MKRQLTNLKVQTKIYCQSISKIWEVFPQLRQWRLKLVITREKINKIKMRQSVIKLQVHQLMIAFGSG